MRHGTLLAFLVLALAACVLLPPASQAQTVVAQDTATDAQETVRDAESRDRAVAAQMRGRGALVDPQIHDLSPWRMFMGADVVVKAVMIGLAFASLATWTVFVAKSIELTLARTRLRRALADLQPALSLPGAQAIGALRNTVLEDLLLAAENELTLSANIGDAEAVKERTASHLSDVVKAEMARMRRGMGLLATIGSTAPFVGLFGTVWGIMNAFIGISKSQTTNLAVVAPGIAEALLATAIGLVAAIPAVIIYNHFSRGTKAYAELVARAAGSTARLLSRDLDRNRQQPSPPMRARA